MVRFGYDLGKEHRSLAIIDHVLGHVDLPRMRRGGVTAQVFGIILPPWTSRRAASRRVARQAALVDGACERFGADLMRARTADDVVAARRAGAIAVLVGIEGSYGLVENDDALDRIVASGAVYCGPAHVLDSEAGLSNLRHTEGSLSPAGHDLVEALRAREVMIDLAHMARGPFLEVCGSSTSPVIVSHTGLAALHPIWRNIDDDQVRAVAATGGVVGVIMTPRFLGRPGVEGVVDHLEHLVAVGGEDVAALGSDFDGLVTPPRDIVDVAGLPLITDELLRRGHGEAVVRKILGENVLRVLPRASPAPRVTAW
jgi:membrane dipeptidase